jgi:hypothetical protein
MVAEGLESLLTASAGAVPIISASKALKLVEMAACAGMT